MTSGFRLKDIADRQQALISHLRISIWEDSKAQVSLMGHRGLHSKYNALCLENRDQLYKGLHT
jgi:hypothetical protein